jgi:hypothetical protein
VDWQLIFVSATFFSMLGGVMKISAGYRKDLQDHVDLMFKRFDEHKRVTDRNLAIEREANDKKYMRADNCGLVQASYSREMEAVKDTLREMSRKLDKLLEERRVSSH